MAKVGDLRSDLESAWFSLLKKLFPPEYTVIFQDELSGNDAPQPQLPYATLKITSGPVRIGMRDAIVSANLASPDDDIHNLCGLRNFTLNIQAFGQGAHDSLDIIQTKLQNPIVRELLRKKASIGITSSDNVLDIPDLLETGFRRRSSLDIIFNTARNIDIKLGVIESVEIDGSISDETGTVTDPPPFTVDLN